MKPARQGKVERRLKTVSAYREVDLHPDVAKLLNEFIGTRTSGFLFQASNGKPLTLTNILRRHLHPALKELGYVNPYTGTHKAGTRLVERWLSAFNTLHTNAAASVPFLQHPNDESARGLWLLWRIARTLGIDRKARRLGL